MDHTTSVEDFDSQPFKKTKYSESSVLDDPLPSPTISSSSLVSECSESIGLESDNHIDGDALSSAPSPTLPQDGDKQTIPESDTPSATPPTMSTLSPVFELVNEEAVSQDGDKQALSHEDYMEPDEPNHIINNVTYDYLPQGKLLFFTIVHMLFITIIS